MLNLFREGGYPMFFILGFGCVALAWAAWYAARGKHASLRFVVAMMAATTFATASGICADLGATFKFVAGSSEEMAVHQQDVRPDAEQRARILAEGAGESMAPGIMGFSLLALTGLLLAVGGARVGRLDVA